MLNAYWSTSLLNLLDLGLKRTKIMPLFKLRRFSSHFNAIMQSVTSNMADD
jgi:hypothetical protein